MQPSTARTPSPPPLRRHAHRTPPPPRRGVAPFEPVPFRARPCPAPGTEISRPVALRSRNASFCASGACGGCSGAGACRSGARSWSLGEMRPPGNRVVSFGSAVTPQSGGSTDGEEAGRSSWEWPWEEEERAGGVGARRRAARARGSRSDSSSSSADWAGSAKLERCEWGVRGAGRYRGAASAPRSQSALVDAGAAGACCATARADGPRPWDMTEGSQASKNFASFGFRRNHEGGTSFADTFSSRHLLRHSLKGGGRSGGNEWLGMGDGNRGGKKRFRFLRKLSVSGLRWSTGG